MYWIGALFFISLGIWLGLTGRIRRRWKVLAVIGYLIVVNATPLKKTGFASASTGGLVVGLVLSQLGFIRTMVGQLPNQSTARGRSRSGGSRRTRGSRRASGGQRLARGVNQAGNQLRDNFRDIGQRYREARDRPRDNGREE
jgi:hypothetical protein